MKKQSARAASAECAPTRQDVEILLKFLLQNDLAALFNGNGGAFKLDVIDATGPVIVRATGLPTRDTAWAGGGYAKGDVAVFDLG